MAESSSFCTIPIIRCPTPTLVLPSDILHKLDFSQVPKKLRQKCRKIVLAELNQIVLLRVQANLTKPDQFLREAQLITLGQNCIQQWLRLRTKAPTLAKDWYPAWRNHIISNYAPTEDCLFPFGVLMDGFRRQTGTEVSAQWCPEYSEFLQTLGLRIIQVDQYWRINLDPLPHMLSFLERLYNRDNSQRIRMNSPRKTQWNLAEAVQALSLEDGDKPMAMEEDCRVCASKPRVIFYDEEDNGPMCPPAPKKVPVYRVRYQSSSVARKLDFEAMIDEEDW